MNLSDKSKDAVEQCIINCPLILEQKPQSLEEVIEKSRRTLVRLKNIRRFF